MQRQGSQASSEPDSPAKFSEEEVFELKPEEGEIFKHAKIWERI